MNRVARQVGGGGPALADPGEYDQVLDTGVLVDAVPDRYRHLTGLDRYFAMAHDVQDVPALEMIKWFDIGYH
ncbi:hypothetical protein ACFQVD_19185 [Streptosporangium amethystogenes subsp. fukuiense]|uniref:Cobalamin-independent methionine synthase MetE N-terminal domain-containing protein n=1 Tax=Streptosporangium amethystogenes subsp. fukuiense TaxID=698418 RepID=A0ABW2T0S6_9ACTN